MESASIDIDSEAIVSTSELPNTRRRLSSSHQVNYQDIPEFYSGRYLFITGGTGFIGKVLVEKLLRCCPNVSGIFLLTRPKKGRTPFQRGEDLCNSPIFKSLRESNPKFLEKLVVMHGDINDEEFGLHEDNLRRITSEVSVVFHVAATVSGSHESSGCTKTYQPLPENNEPQVAGAAEDQPRIFGVVHGNHDLGLFHNVRRSLIHVSTAYANCNRNHIDEIIYPPSIDPDKIIDLTNWLPEEAIQSITPSLLQKMPNTYTFTKGLAEYYLLKKAFDLPLAIVRPSIVGAAWKEPIPGWVDNCNGPSMLFIATGKGFLRSMIGVPSGVCDVIPVDLTVNLIIAAAWRTGCYYARDNGKLIVYNNTSGAVNPLRWDVIGNVVPSSFRKNPLDLAFRRPKMAFTTNPLMHSYWVSVSHLLPAYISDMALRLVGKKPRLVKSFGKIHKCMESMGYFSTNEWEWRESNLSGLVHDMLPRDQKIFYLDVRELDWEHYLEDFCLGIKRFILNEDLGNLPRARLHLKRLRIIRYAFNTILIAMLWRFLIAKSHLAGGLWYMVLNLVFKFVRFFRMTSSYR